MLLRRPGIKLRQTVVEATFWKQLPITVEIFIRGPSQSTKSKEAVDNEESGILYTRSATNNFAGRSTEIIKKKIIMSWY
jgi:hypothetical protein